MGMVALQLAGGLAVLYLGGELLVRGSAALATRLRVSALFIGTTVVAFGTSAPELAVSVNAAFTGHGALAMGNVIGSNIANVLLVLGLVGLVAPIVWNPHSLRSDAAILAGASALFCALAAFRGLSQLDGLALVAALCLIIGVAYRREGRDESFMQRLIKREARELTAHAPRFRVALPTALVGMAAVVFGADLLVRGAVGVAHAAGISEGAIGLTLVAVGTSLPEIATTLVAAHHRKTEIAVGTVIGSNLFNQLGVAGAAALASQEALPARLVAFELWGMFGVMLVAAISFSVLSYLGRRQAILMLLMYATWVSFKL